VYKKAYIFYLANLSGGIILIIKELLNKQVIEQNYNKIKTLHEKHLKKFGVKLPNLRYYGNYTKKALVLVYLAYGYPNTRVVTKGELTEYIEHFFGKVNDVQHARHLGCPRRLVYIIGRQKRYK